MTEQSARPASVNVALQRISALEWNARYKVGVSVMAVIKGHDELVPATTSGAAWRLGTGESVVKLKGLPGNHLLQDLVPME